MGQTNVLPDARLPLHFLTPSGPIFHTGNRKYFSKKKKKNSNNFQEKRKEKENTSLKIEQMF